MPILDSNEGSEGNKQRNVKETERDCCLKKLGKTSLRKSFINPGVHKTGRCQMCGHLRGERSTQRD